MPMKSQRYRCAPEERFWRFARDLGSCIEWTGFRYPNGYGLFFRGNHRADKVYAHRWSYEFYIGQISDGLEIDHLCRNHSCVNPLHLEAVTRRENLIRGCTFTAANAARTHCPRGHEYTADNLVSQRQGRKCKRCHRERERDRRRL